MNWYNNALYRRSYTGIAAVLSKNNINKRLLYYTERITAMDIFKTLEAAADPEKARGMSAYLKDQFAFLGIQKPERAKLTKDFLNIKKQGPVDWEFVESCYAKPEREFHYLAVSYVLLIKDKLVPGDLKRIESLITRNSWWDTVDMFNLPIGVMFLKYPQITGMLRKWMSGDNMWLRRSTIIFQLHLKEKTDTALLAEAIEKNLGSKEFFINKAIGWALREYSKTDPEWVRAFIRSHELAPLSVREAGKYI
jgi:3-methyladenine DNA glycosylase AlkD